ncbi:MAG: hypothetical protein ACFE9L_13775 [Candidatus Hodarchaeota archaeon]
MRKKIISMTVVLVLACSILGTVILVLASKQPAFPEYKTIDIGPELREYPLPENIDVPGDFILGKSDGGGASILQSPDYYDIGDIQFWGVYDIEADFYGYPLAFDLFELRAIGNIAEVWVQLDLSYPSGPADIITDEQVQYILGEYESHIYPTCADYYGTPDFWQGSGPFYEVNGRHVILISNVRDTQYYDPSYPYFVIGFYWGLMELLYERNIITLDSLDWDIIAGPPNYAYDGTTAHELQHLIHDDLNTFDDTFMNECCSVYAEMLCGYGTPWNDINSFLATPDNSLTEWDDQSYNDLADYGAAGLWGIYLNDHFGADFLGNHVQNGIPGIYGLNSALALWGTSFDEVFHDWTIANYLHTNSIGKGRYNYKSIDLQDANPIEVHELRSKFPIAMSGSDFGETYTILGYPTGIINLGPYSSDYILFDDWDDPAQFSFDGDDTAVFGWTMTDFGWYSGSGDLVNFLLYGEAFVHPADPYLEFDTWYYIEPGWDFGFVQVSTDGGYTWASLANPPYTTEDHQGTHPDIVANLPGLTDYSGGWMTMQFDLSFYAGETVLIGFRYMTDWYTSYPGWYIDEPTVSGDPLALTADYPPADYSVTIIYRRNIGDITLDTITETGTFSIEGKRLKFDVLVIVSHISMHGYADYSFGVEKL